MESWTRVIVEWINCLGIAQPSVEDVHELQDCVLYQKLISQLCHENSEASTNTTTTSTLDERELVSEFIKAEYPEFMVSNKCSTGIPDELYIASLLLTQCSQKAAFHRPMCVNLKHETQIHIKKFLEMVLPYGKSITREIIGVAIMEIGDATPNTPPSTPIVRPLREFFNSPAARSAQSQRFMNDRNRELRRLKAQLETEQFEKADLIEDIRIQEEKIQNLQKKLQEKSQELKSLRNERFKPPTPQSCRKNKRPSDNEERYKRELEQLEDSNIGLQSEIEKLQDEREELTRRLTSKDRQYSALKEKFDQCERNMEALSIQLEMKNHELFGLRLNNEELREHIREIQKSTMGEQSFEMEPINRARSPMLLNSNEALSSIVDIQLQEAKEESMQLKNHLDAVNQRLEVVLRECDEIKQLNAVLQEKASKLDIVSVSLRTTEERLSYSAQKLECLEQQKSKLIETLAKLDDELASNKDLLAAAENRRASLESELQLAISKSQNFEASLEKEKATTANLESTISRVKEERDDLQKRLATTEDELKSVNDDKKVFEFDLQEKIKHLGESENALINEKSRVTELETLVANAKKESEDLRILLETSDKSLSHVTEEKQKLELNLQKRMKDLEESEALLKNEKIKVAELESTVDRAKIEYKDLQSLISLKEENLSRLNEDIKYLKLNLDETKQKLDESEISLNNEKSTVMELKSLVTRTKEECEDLKAQLTLNEEELSVLKKNNESLELNLQESENKLEESEASLKSEKIKVAELEIAMSTLQKDFDVLQEELRSNEESLAIERAKVADLELIVARGKKDSEDLQNLLEELRSALENEKSRTAELKDIVSRSQITCEELETLLRSKEDLLEETLQRAGSLDAELETCRLKISDLELSVRSKTSRSAELESECSRTKEHSAKVQAELASKIRELAETEMMKTNTEVELNQLNAEMRVMEADLKKLRNEFSHVEDEKKQSLLANKKIEEYARLADDKIASLESKIVDYERRIEQLDEATTVERQNVKILQAELSEKNSRLEELTIRHDETKKRESTTTIALEAAEKKVAELTELGEEVESQLAQEREQLATIRAEKKTLEDKLASYICSEADLKEQIGKIAQELKDSDENLHERIATIAILKNNEMQLQDAKCQLENKLEEEQQKSTATLTEKLNLEQELASYVQLAANMKEQICKIEKELKDCDTNLQKQQKTNATLKEDNIVLTEKISKIMEELEESNKNLQDQNATIATLKKIQSELQDAKIQLENKLEEEQQKSATTLTEKLNLEQELTKFVQSAVDTKEQICKIEKELKDCDANLQKQQEANAALKEDNIAITELRNKVENELAQIKELLSLTQNEKQALQQEISSYIRSSSSLEEKIAKMEIVLEELGKNKQEQDQIIEALREKERELIEFKAKLENELIEERAQLTELRNEKEMLEEEASLYGRSNEDLGNKIVALQTEIKGYCKDLQTEREVNEELKKLNLELNDECKTLKSEGTQQRDALGVLENEKISLQQELFANARSQADMNEEISALHTELEGSRKDLQQLREINDKLKEKITEANEKIDLLQIFESRSEKLSCDLEIAKRDNENLSKRTAELSEELKSRVEEITRAEKQLQDVKREKELFIVELEERLQTSDNLVASLKKRLVSAEESCVEAKLEEKLKEEALAVIRTKLEQLNKEKIESELRMKEVILNLQEVRSSQDGVLQAQARTLKEKSDQLEEAEKELVDLKKLLTTNASKIEREKSACREAEVQCEKLKEQNQVQSNLVKELQTALEIEQRKVEESTKRCKLLENNVEDLARLSGNLKLELNALWSALNKACPEIVRPKVSADAQKISDDSEIQKLSFTVQSFTDDAKTICKVVTNLSEANDKLKSNMKEIVQVSENLKLELNALWDSVRRACPELARPQTGTEKSPNSPEISEISYAVKAFADDAKTIRKAVSILSEANETLKEHLDGEKEIAKNSAKETEKIKHELDDRISRMEIEQKNRNLYLSSLVQKKKNLQELLSMAMNKRDQVDEQLSALTDKWKIVAKEAQDLLNTGSSACDELKHLQVKRTELDNTLAEINDRHSRNLKPLLKTLCRIFVWSETKLQEAQEISALVTSEFSTDNELSEEQEIVEKEISRNDKVQLELEAANGKVETFVQLLESYEASLKSGAIKRPTSVEEKLQSQLDKLSKERKEMKDKLDAMRMRNAKMEKNMDDLRNENKKLKTEVVAVPPAAVSNEELESLRTMTEKLQKEVLRLQIENDELVVKKGSENQDVETRLKEVHAEYGLKLEKIKQKMKTAYNEQITKLNQEQEKTLKEKMSALRVQMEKQCRKYTEDIAKYKAHISDLSSRYWDVGEKLLTETQEKQAALRQLEQLRGTEEKHEASAEVNQQMSVTQNRLKTASLDRRDFAADRATRDGTTRPGYRAVEVIEEETTTYSTRRHSVKSIQAMGHAFNAEDEEGEVFDSVYLADLKEGRCAPPIGPDFDRLSELRMRNSMCRPHLKSSYAVETHFQPITLNEDDIKGNELKSPTSRVLRERNVERRTTATPRGLKNLFGTSISKRQDENATGTPKGRRLSNIFRKQRTERN